MFKIEKSFCKKFREKDNPVFNISNIKPLFKYFSKDSLKLATINYFKNFLCFLFGENLFLIMPEFPFLEVIDEKSKMELLKIITLYERLNIKMIKLTKNKVLLYNFKCEKEFLHKYVYYNLINNKIIKLNLNEEEEKLLRENILVDFNNDNVFNLYLRRKILDENFWISVKQKKQKVSIENLEKLVESEFKKRCKEDKNYLTEMKKLFNIEMNYLEKKINYKKGTTNYNMTTKFIKDNTKPFKFPLKEYFGERNPISYQCFKSLLDEFKKSITKEDLKELCTREKT